MTLIKITIKDEEFRTASLTRMLLYTNTLIHKVDKLEVWLLTFQNTVHFSKGLTSEFF